MCQWASHWRSGTFHRRWNVFQSGSRIADPAAAPRIFQCADGVLGDALLKVDSDITTRPPDELLEMMNTLAVIPVATGVFIEGRTFKHEAKARRAVSIILI